MLYLWQAVHKGCYMRKICVGRDLWVLKRTSDSFVFHVRSMVLVSCPDGVSGLLNSHYSGAILQGSCSSPNSYSEKLPRVQVDRWPSGQRVGSLLLLGGD